MEKEIVRLVFVTLQFTNIVLSSMLIMSGIFLFSYVKSVIHHVDKYLHTMLVLHILASILILSSYDLKIPNDESIWRHYLTQLSILNLVVINGLFQMGIYRFFHNAVCRICVIHEFLYFIKSKADADADPIDPHECVACRYLANLQQQGRVCNAPGHQ